jgi:hypothetical protein
LTSGSPSLEEEDWVEEEDMAVGEEGFFDRWLVWSKGMKR